MEEDEEREEQHCWGEAARLRTAAVPPLGGAARRNRLEMHPEHQHGALPATSAAAVKRRRVEDHNEARLEHGDLHVGSPEAVALPMLEHWGLDPLFWAHVKLFVGDLLALPPMPGFIEPFNLHGHPVARVAVMGVIVEALPRPNRLSLMVDDGTGCIQCTYFTNSIREGGLSPDELQVGTLVSIQGKLHQFQQQRSIAIFRIGIEEDPNSEVQHVLEVIRLTQSVYQRSSPVSNFVK